MWERVRAAVSCLLVTQIWWVTVKANQTYSFLSSAPHNVITPLLLLGVMTCHYLRAAQWALASGAGTETHCLNPKGGVCVCGGDGGGEVTWLVPHLLNVAWKPAQWFDVSSGAMNWTQVLEVYLIPRFHFNHLMTQSASYQRRKH